MSMGLLFLAVIGHLCTITVVQTADIEINPRGSAHTRPLKGSILFTCTMTGDNSPDINPYLKWFDKEGKEIDQRTGRVYVEDDGVQALKLYLTQIEASDAGIYKCEGVLDGSKQEESVELLLFKDITFDHAPDPQHPRINTDALIECVVSGQPNPEVSWRYRGQRVVTGDRYSQDPDGLRVRNITQEDNGRYMCRAEVPSDGRYDERPIDVTVHIPPTITVPPDNEEGIEGHEVSLTCHATGLPDPKYEFYKDDNQQPVRSTDRIEVDNNSGNIHFRPIEKGDEGNYRCKAVNDVGEAEETGSLRVLVRPDVWELKNVTQTEGLVVDIICKSRGDPDPIMTWRKVGSPLDYEDGDNENGRINVKKLSTGESRLQISNLSPDDTANYTCKAVNSAGHSERNGTVTVNFKPRFSPEHNRLVYNWAGKTRNITCHALGEPMPSVEWWRFNYRIRTNETFKEYQMGRNSNLQVTVREDDQEWIYGFYTCRARNNLGDGNLEIEMKRAETPDAVKSVRAKDQSPTTVTLAVVPPDNNGGVDIIGYRVEFEGQSSDFALDKPIRIENLTPSTTYIFVIRPRNEVGVGVPESFTHTTPSISKPYPIVLKSNPEGIHPFEYTLNWEIPRTGGQPIREYRFKWRTVKLNDGNVIKEPVSNWIERRVDDDTKAPMLFYKLEALNHDSTYQVTVEARNDIGWSDPNPQFTFKTAKDPSYIGVVIDPLPATPDTGEAKDQEGKGDPAAVAKRTSLGTGAVIGIVIAVFFIFLIIVDISCYFMNGCGVLMCICVHLCGKQQPMAKEKAMEEGESKDILKQPMPQPIEEARVAGETHALPPQPDEGEDDGVGEPDEPLPEPKNPDEKKPLSEAQEGDPNEEHLQAPAQDEENKEALKKEIEEEDANEKSPLTTETKEYEPGAKEATEADQTIEEAAEQTA